VSALSHADETSPAPDSSSAVTESELPALGKYDHGYKIKSVYDKFEDRTIVTLEKIWQDEDGLTNVSKYSLSPRFWYEGHGSPSLQALHLELLLKSSVEVGKEGTSGQLDQFYKFADPETRKLVFLVDGSKRVVVGSGEHEGGLSARNAGSEIFGMDRQVREQVVYHVPMRDWLQLISGTTLDGRFGKKAFKWDKPKYFAALKDFTSRMRSEAGAARE
jgi:hypothetical protein